MTLPYPLGAIPSRPDPRDYKFADLATIHGARIATTAKEIDRKMYTMVSRDFRMNQNDEGTCVGHALTNVILAGPSVHPTTPEFATVEDAHQYARALYFETTGDSTYQLGAFPREACAVLLTRGTITSYWKVVSVEDIIACLLTYGPLSITVPWYQSMFLPDGDHALKIAYGNHWLKVDLNSEHVGYHELALTGIDLSPNDGAPAFVRVENSWGPKWGQNGTTRLTIERLRILNVWDNWTFVEEPI